MRTIKSGYFSSALPVAAAVALLVMAALHAYGNGAAPREPLAAEQVTAELARTVSYGLIDPGGARTASAVRHAVAPAAAPLASST